MLIDKEKCIRCGQCIPYCPMGCISKTDDGVAINTDECVECEICRNAKVCPRDALYMPKLEYPRTLRSQFSNPLIPHPDTGVPGRGTEEMKTNDVTGRFPRGKAGIAIGYDNRHMSKEFAFDCADLLAKNNIKSYVFESLRPTPELSFAVRHLNCFGGIMITASHNPKEYNGYKLYDDKGCQLIPCLASQVIDKVNAIEDELAIDANCTEEQKKLPIIVAKFNYRNLFVSFSMLEDVALIGEKSR